MVVATIAIILRKIWCYYRGVAPCENIAMMMMTSMMMMTMTMTDLVTRGSHHYHSHHQLVALRGQNASNGSQHLL